MNSRRHTITSLSIVFLAVTIMSVSAFGQNAYAGGAGMSLSVDCSGSSCDVSGSSDRSDFDVTITASNDLAIVGIAQANVSGIRSSKLIPRSSIYSNGFSRRSSISSLPCSGC